MEMAQQAYGRGQYAEAVKLCKQALKNDRTNYDGFVLLGMALVRSGQHFEQAEMSFKKAISLRSSALSAYKGLIELHETTGDEQKAIEAREAAFRCEVGLGNVAAATELAKQLTSHFALNHKHEAAMQLWDEMLLMQLNESERLKVLCSLVDVEASVMNGNVEEYQRKKELKARLTHIVRELPYDEHFQDLLLQMIISDMRSGQEAEMKKQALAHCLVALSQCPTPALTDFLLAFLEEDGVEGLVQSVECGCFSPSIQSVRKRIAHARPAKGLASLVTDSRLERRRHFSQREVLMDENSICGWRNLVEVQASEGKLEDAWKNCARGFSSLARARKLYGFSLKRAELNLTLTQGHILLSRRLYNEADPIFRRVAMEARELVGNERKAITKMAFQGLVEVFLAQGKHDMASSTLESILTIEPNDDWALSERGWLAFRAGSVDKALNDLKQALSICPQSAKYHYRLACVYWDGNRKEDAFNELVESGRIDPSQADVFYRLGAYYAGHVKDTKRAMRCYQKVVALDPENSQAGEALCDMLDACGQSALAKSVCSEASKTSARVFWASRRLGFIQAAHSEWSLAVSSIQVALRHYTKDARLWEALGLCYKHLSMFTAALKAYQRALDNDPLSVFAVTEMGSVYLQTLAHSKASECFRQALSIIPDNLAANYGLASALLGEARECMKLGASVWASTLLKEATDLARRNVVLGGHLSCVWKQLGDTKLLFAQKMAFSANKSELAIFPEAVVAWEEECKNAAKVAVHAYKHALHLLPGSGTVYHDLGIALKLVSDLEQQSLQQEWTCHELAVCGGLRVDGGNADLWTTLGLVTEHEGLKQHAFIQALRLDGNHVVAWTFLGQLYSKLKDERLAKLCFDRARSADPASPLPWAGTAALPSTTVHDAYNSCYYALYLSSSLDMQVPLGHLAAKTRNLGLPQVKAVLEQAALSHPSMLEAHNLDGLSYESRENFAHAVQSFTAAKVLAASLFKHPPSETRAITANLARALCKIGHFHAAVAEYEHLAAMGAMEPYDFIGYAVSLWHCGEKQKAESFAQKALGAGLVLDTRRASAISLYSKIVYSNQGALAALNVLSSVPETLFSEKELSLTMIALGICSCKLEMVSAALRRSHRLLTSNDASEANLLLAAGMRALNGGAGVVGNLVRAVHMYPQSGLLRSKLGEMLLSQDKVPANVAGHLCRADALFSKEARTRRLTAIVLTDTALSGGAAGAGNAKQLEKLVHEEPWNVVARYCWVLLLMKRAKSEQFPHGLCQTVIRAAKVTLLLAAASIELCYIRAQLELCISECSLQMKDAGTAAEHAKIALEAAELSPSVKLPTTVQLARSLSASGDRQAEGLILGWKQQGFPEADLVARILLLDMELRLGKQTTSIELRQDACEERAALIEFVRGRHQFSEGNLEAAEASAAKATCIWQDNPVLQLYHGAICMELVQRSSGAGSYLSKAISSLSKAVQGKKKMQVPVACALLAQAEWTRDSKRAASIRKWAANIRNEFLTWTGERPAELYFQMFLVAKQALTCDNNEEDYEELRKRSSRSWLQIALHINPSCARYWASVRAT